MGSSARKRPSPGRGGGVCARASLFSVFSGTLLGLFLLGTVWIHTVHLGPLPGSLTPNLSYKTMAVALNNKVRNLQHRSERLGESLESWRSKGYEAQGFRDVLAASAGIEEGKGVQEVHGLQSSVKGEEGDSSSTLAQPEPRGNLRKQASPISTVKPMLLVVGGTDGSGTRSVVDLLQSLGVKMIVEDEGTMDVHGEEMRGGWPPPVKMVLMHSHSADYEVDSLPDDVQRHVTAEVRKFLSAKDAEGKQGRKGRTQGVSWGFKAPVSMLLVPFFAQMTSGVKFLHVVRDGRDISFSGNQSPVKKFYDVNYGVVKGQENADPYHEKPHLQAMRLWSDWNVDIAEWSSRHQDGVTFDYLQIRTEDLVDPQTKYDVTKKVARFVGSPMGDDELCCMVRAPTKWMGSHETNPDRHNHGSASSKVKSRYGSWKEKVLKFPGLQEQLESVGSTGLARFGYHPRRMDVEFPADLCPAEPAHCPQAPARWHGRGHGHGYGYGEPRPLPADMLDSNGAVLVPVSSGECSYAGNVDFRGPHVDLYADNAASADDCCRLCLQAPECSAFTFALADGLCYLKTSSGTPTPNSALVSGTVVAKPV